MSKEAMKLALEALEDLGMKHFESTGEVLYKDVFTALHQAIAEAEKQEQGEPVAYVHADELEELSHCNGMSVWAENALAHTEDSLSKQLLPSGYVAIYTHPQPKRRADHYVPLTDEQIKRLIVEFGKEFNDFDSLPEVCLLVSYDPEVGRIPERWEPKWHVFQAVRYVLHAAHGIKEQS